MIKNIIRNSYTIIKTIEPKKAFLLGILFIIFVIAIITFTLSSLSRLTSSYNDYNNELNIGTTQNIKYYISPFAIGEMEKNINKLLFSGLIKKDTPNKNNLENNLINDLAKTITYNNNNTEIVVELRDDIYFSNGDPITTDDVI
ncbi:MAG: hypothetical protein QM532_01700 [Cyanobium sp. MAG06]|nr:hypothetical protein [Cyanobium sp. MAG06]